MHSQSKLGLKVCYNSAMDYRAKCELWDFDPEYPPEQQPFLLEPICVFVREEKMTSDMASHIQFHAHREASPRIMKYWIKSNSKSWTGIRFISPTSNVSSLGVRPTVERIMQCQMRLYRQEPNKIKIESNKDY